jgi:hypothetical protein
MFDGLHIPIKNKIVTILVIVYVEWEGIKGKRWWQ